MWEITFIGSGKTVYWTTSECHEFFGKAEFNEISLGYLPNVVAVRVDAEGD